MQTLMLPFRSTNVYGVNMKATQQFRRGLRKAAEVTNVSTRQASLKAGYNQNQLNRFLSGKQDIRLATLDDVCRKGFGLQFDTVWNMGK